MAYRYSPAARHSMTLIREYARTHAWVICWWCGSRPLPGKQDWAADHVFALMGEASPIAAACFRCNLIRQQQVPDWDRVQRLLKSDQVARSVSGADILAIGKAECVRLWSRDDCIALLLAAVPTKVVVYEYGNRIKHLEYCNMLERSNGFLG